MFVAVQDHWGTAGTRLGPNTEASRARLRAMYEEFGFRHHSDWQAGPYYVARYEYRV